MAQQGYFNWVGKSGRTYKYGVYPIDETFEKGIPANYLYAKKRRSGWEAMYVGETSEVSERLTQDSKYQCALDKGATHIHFHKGSAEESDRKEEVENLINVHSPQCND